MLFDYKDKRQECKWYLVCPMKRYYDKGILDNKWVHDYCYGIKRCMRYDMEERGEPHPDWMLPDGTLEERLKLF